MRQLTRKIYGLLQERIRRVGSYVLSLLEECALIGRPCLVDRTTGNAKGIQHGTVLADWWNTGTDMLLPVADQKLVAGPDIP